MSIYKILKEAKEDVEMSSFYNFRENIHLTENDYFFNRFVSTIKSFEKKPIGYKAFDLTNATKIRICVNEIMIFKSISNLSMIEKLSKHIYDNYEEILENNKKFDYLKTQIDVFVDNYKPFDFFKFQEKRKEYKVSISYLENNEVRNITTNMGELLAIKLKKEQFDFVDFDFKEGKNKRVNRKFNPEYMPSFKITEFKGSIKKGEFEYLKENEYIFEFSNKSYYKELIDMINY
ncbi:hypothetical protein [Pseudomonas aeruginosa]|uniref:hypothetical protein n=1 Tax=Pseudomonas aeruginosa TaxID=287 RepID=UPI000AB7174B|nr:hypothetical protein [Pseudomonas aeruginosa]